MRRCKGKAAELRQAQPNSFGWESAVGPEAGCLEGFQGNSVTGDRVLDSAEPLKRRRNGSERGQGRLLQAGGWHLCNRRRELDIRELPQVGVYYSARALANEVPSPVSGYECGEEARSGAGATAQIGQFVRPSLPEGQTVRGQRAFIATRLFGRANQSAEFHERLVELRAGWRSAR